MSDFIIEGERRERFLRELSALLNRYSVDAATVTPDWILAAYLLAQINSLWLTINAREKL